MGCGYKFQNKRRKEKLASTLLDQYVWQRQTYKDLAEKYDRSRKWVQTKLDHKGSRPVITLDQRDLIIVADTTFFSRTSGLTVFREPNLKKNVWWRETTYEKAEVYYRGKQHLEQRGLRIKAVVLDGRKGIRAVFMGMPIQMCHFHQQQIIIRYLTTRPRLEASRELKAVANTLARTDEQTFTKVLSSWYEKWCDFLKQRTTDFNTGRWFYTHKRLRAAYRSLKTNVPHLFTYQKYPELNIPNTTNSLDGFFNRLKGLLNVHRGLNPKRRMRIVSKILRNRSH